MSKRSSEELRKPLRGRAVEAGDGMLHIEGEEGTTLCGEAVEAYPLHWATKTVIACGVCLMEAGVPLSTPNASGGSRA
jgi:hypothetical protein